VLQEAEQKAFKAVEVELVVFLDAFFAQHVLEKLGVRVHVELFDTRL
jgi:hypothetical protein